MTTKDWKLEDCIKFHPNNYQVKLKSGIEWVHKEDIKEFLRREWELIKMLYHNQITWKEFIKRREELAGKSLVESK